MRRKHRNSGEGLIRQRKDGRWEARISLGFRNGKRVQKSFYGAAAGEVQTALLKARADHARGLPVAAERQTVAQFLNDWLEHSVKPSVRFSTWENYEHITRNHLIPELGHLKLEKLTPNDVRRMLKRKLDAGGLSARSVAYLRVILRAALNQARNEEIVVRNVAEIARPPKVEQPKKQRLTVEQAHALLDAAKSHRLYALYAVALALGMRVGEIRGLRWQDVDLEHGQIVVSQALQRQKGNGLVLTETKTDRSHRTLDLADAPALLAALKTHRVRQLEERLALGPEWQDNGFVFASTVGTGLEPRNLHRAFKLMLKKANLADVRFHDLRHSAASLMLAQGVDLVIVRVLGHSSISITANLYIHETPKTMRSATQKVADVLFRR